MNSVLIDYRNEVQERVNEFSELAEKHGDAFPEIVTQSREMQQLCQEKLKNFKPHIMVYGIYNAGKSSIINELIRADKAVVQDRPTTDKIDSYEWNGYLLDDTPGVGAPMEHEKVTQEHLKKTDVVLFVMSNTGANELKQNYERMKDIIDAGKKLIIVLNDKNGDLEHNDLAIQMVLNKVAKNMEQVGIRAADETYHFVVVNAARAHKGRIEHKNVLWEKSHMEELERVMLIELKNAGGFSILQRTLRDVEYSMDKILVGFGKNNTDSNLEILQTLLQKVHTQEKQMKEMMSQEITIKTQQLGYMLPDLIWRKSNDGQNIDNKEIEQLTKQEVQTVINSLNEKMKYLFHTACRNLSNSLQQQLEQSQLEHQTVIKTSELNNMNLLQDDELRIALEKVKQVCDACVHIEEYSEKENLNIAQDTLKTVMEWKATEAIVENIGKEILKTAAGSLVKGSVVGKIIMTPFPPLAPIILMVTILMKIFGSNGDLEQKRKEAEAQNKRAQDIAQAKQQAQERLRQQCKYFSADLKNHLLDPFFSTIESGTNLLEKPILEEMKQLKSMKNELFSDIEKMRLVFNDCERVRCAIMNDAEFFKKDEFTV